MSNGDLASLSHMAFFDDEVFSIPYMISSGHSGMEIWERRYVYLLRWMIEYAFSAVKRTLGERCSLVEAT